MMFLTILINSTAQERTILSSMESQTDFKLEHKTERQSVWKNTKDGNKADGAVIFCSHAQGFEHTSSA